MTDRAVRNAAILSGWRKSSYSDANAGSCLEVLDNHPSGIPVRDSKNPHGPAVLFSAPGWSSFITALKTDRLPA
ncbi:DUF397 domain-containing protein [Streptomyces chromofuscus]|uniref:DUF397 domain-containing protein n=1 Tax=Streptomyces chromofuscus TaxID=42881 RepID=A0A7M2TF02_STRCW|nr:DUF397 domain-containing protein [Streptomyces chromofuscus]QOV46804.1 DUF397 domain-containing protein [Streptomyces chromofuscus]GGT13647.1 hypothetical protein GCM10010254_37700 [Streptomyces chromofuscus]